MCFFYIFMCFHVFSYVYACVSCIYAHVFTFTLIRIHFTYIHVYCVLFTHAYCLLFIVYVYMCKNNIGPLNKKGKVDRYRYRYMLFMLFYIFFFVFFFVFLVLSPCSRLRSSDYNRVLPSCEIGESHNLYNVRNTGKH